MALLVPIDDAAMRSFHTWLSSKLPSTGNNSVTVLKKWPDADKELPARAVSIIFAGKRVEELCQPTVEATEIIHNGVTARITTATATDIPTACTLLNACKTSYNSSHRTSTSAHTAADTTNVITSPNATDQASALTLATEMYADVTAHAGLLTSHPTADTVNLLSGAIANTIPAIVAAAEAIRNALNAHYVARVYVWRVAGCEQPVQLDVWAGYDATREDIIARLEPLLHADPSESAGWPYSEPARNGTVVALGNGWPGYAEFFFDSPLREDTATSTKTNQFRAIYSGTCDFWLLIKKQSPRLARMTLRQVIDDLTAATASIATSTSGTPTVTYTLP